jgi:hypothetical protein
MKTSLSLFLFGFVAFHVGVYLLFGLPAVLISVGLVFVAGGLLVDWENE